MEFIAMDQTNGGSRILGPLDPILIAAKGLDVQDTGLHRPSGVLDGDAAGHPASAAKSPSKSLMLKEILVVSGHQSLIENNHDWGFTGKPIPMPHWRQKYHGKGGWPSEPVAHSMKTKVQLSVLVEFDAPPGSKPVRARLIGRGAGIKWRSERTDFHPGPNQVVVEANKLIEQKVQYLVLEIDWSLSGTRLPLENTSSQFNFFVTIGEPAIAPDEDAGNTGPAGITTKRLFHAIKQVGAAGSLDPHTIIQSLIKRWDRFELQNNPKNAWHLANKGAKADCRTIVRYIMNVLKMVGVEGDGQPVLVWERLRPGVPKRGPFTLDIEGEPPLNYVVLERTVNSGDFELVEMHPDKGDLNRPVVMAENEKWRLAMVDKGGKFNAFEGCLRFEHDGVVKLYAGGAGVFNTKEEMVKKVFESLSWTWREKPKTWWKVTGGELKTY